MNVDASIASRLDLLRRGWQSIYFFLRQVFGLGMQGSTSWSCVASWADSGFGRRLLGCNQLVLLSQLGRFWVWSRAWNRQSVRHPRMSDSKVEEDEGS